jgi:hypothetical protein
MRNVLETSQRIGSEPDVARTIALSELGFIAEQRGDPATARSWHLECLTAAQKLGDQQVVALALVGPAGAQALDGHPGLAARLLGAADAVCCPAADGRAAGEGAADISRITAMTRQALPGRDFAAEFHRGHRLKPEQISVILHNRG